jgi:hypothetical protein
VISVVSPPSWLEKPPFDGLVAATGRAVPQDRGERHRRGRLWPAPPALIDGFWYPNGVQVPDVVQCVADELPVASATLVSNDPSYDPLGCMCQAALDLLELLADLATPVPTAK